MVASLTQSQLLHAPRCFVSQLEQSAFRWSDRCRSQRHIAIRRLQSIERAAVNRAGVGAGATQSGSPKPRQLDRAAAALVKVAEEVDDTMHGALAGLGMVAVASAAGLELLCSRARHQRQAERLQTAAAFQRQLNELQAEQATAELRGKRGARDVDSLQRRQVLVAVEAGTAAAAPPPLAAAHPWSFWALCLALMCQLLLSTLQNKRYASTGAPAHTHSHHLPHHKEEEVNKPFTYYDRIRCTPN